MDYAGKWVRREQREVESGLSQLLQNALAGFARKRAFVAGTVVGGEGKEVGGVSLEAGYGVAGHFSNYCGRSRSGVISRRGSKIDLVPGQVVFTVCRPG